ncbi:MAG: hypothetical protein WBE26_13075, partial [Phycisphaerae bacterium]
MLGVVAVGAFAFSLTLQGEAAMKKYGAGKTKIGIQGIQKLKAGPGIQHRGSLPVGPRVTVDYHVDQPSPGPWPGVLMQTRDGCLSDDWCSDCNVCTKDSCVFGICSDDAGWPDAPCDEDDECWLSPSTQGVCELFVSGVKECVHEIEDGLRIVGCDDELECTGIEYCADVEGEAVCQPPVDVPDCGAQVCIENFDPSYLCIDACTDAASCDDDDACTRDICETSGYCTYVDICTPGRCCDGDDCHAVNLEDCEDDYTGATFLVTANPCVELLTGPMNDCPDYGSGIAPQGAYGVTTGLFSPLDCDVHHNMGDDFATDDSSRAVEYMEVELLRFVGHVVGDANARWAIAFHDASGTFIEDVFFPDGQDEGPGDMHVIEVDFDPPLPITTTGYVVWAVTPAFSPGGRVELMATDDGGGEVDIGSNDAGKMWVNGAPADDFLIGVPDVLAFEIVGSPLSGPPEGACCDTELGTCSHTLPWDCAGDDQEFQGVGTFCGVCTAGTGIGLTCDEDLDCNDPPIVGACKDKVCDNDPAQECEYDEDCPQPGGHCVDLSTVCATQACCNDETGVCREVVKPETCATGETGLGYATSCDPDCCPQPAPTGGDDCNLATLHVINVPGIGQDPVTITITGNNSAATPDNQDVCTFWTEDGEELGWWEAFSIDDCANVRLDFCCTQIWSDVTLEYEPLRPAWGNMVSGCNPCGASMNNSGVEPPIGIGIGTSGYARGGPFCEEDNLWQNFGPIPAGAYYYPVYTVPEGTSGVPPGADYQFHITVGYCADNACCYLACTGDPTVVCVTDDDCTVVGGTCEPKCAELNWLECADVDGYYLGKPNINTPVATCDHTPITGTCETGSCCTGPGECEDKAPDRQPTMTKGDCDIAGGTYVGGAECDNPGKPCPVCEFEFGANCTDIDVFAPNTQYVMPSDLSMPGGPVVQADDFIAKSGALNAVCVWGSYLDSRKGSPYYYCVDDDTWSGVDEFMVTVYADDGGMPGALVGQRMITNTVRGIVELSDFETGWTGEYAHGGKLWAYQLAFTPPIVLVADDCYWLEVANNTPAEEGAPPNWCEWNWLQLIPGSENDYSYSGGYDLDNIGAGGIYAPEGARHVDLGFCVDCGMDAGGCGDSPRAACCSCYTATPPSTCYERDIATCASGMWDIYSITCEGYDCPTVQPPGDECHQAIPIVDGIHYYNSRCANNTPGYDSALPESGAAVDFGKDIWYHYTATCTGRLQISMCVNGNSIIDGGGSYDSMLVIYSAEGGDPTVCPCPGDPGFGQEGRGSDEGCNGLADAGAGLVERQTDKGECWTIAVGGWNFAGGPGALNVKCVPAECTMAVPPTPDAVVTDVGNGTRNRYLSVSHVGSRARNVALRVKFVSLPIPHNYADGRTMWVKQPEPRSE